MVPVNFHKWKQYIRRALLDKVDANSSERDPFEIAWACYAFSIDGFEKNQPLLNLRNWIKRWLEEDVWSFERNLGPIALYLWLLIKTGNLPQPEFIDRLVKKVVALNPEEKLSLSRDPEQVFLLSLGIAMIDNQPAKERLIEVSRNQMHAGPLRRRILYAAALNELSQNVTPPDAQPADEGDIVALVWWAERYQGNKHEAWNHFSSIAERIAFDPASASDTQRILSVPEMAMLYQAMSRQAEHPEPTMLFDYFPFHHRLREIAREHFLNGKCGAAVFEATKVLNEMIQSISGVTDKSESELVQATMKQISNPPKLKIKFNEFLHEESGKNEQAGLALICEGVFKAFRNPKGHKPEDHNLVQLDPYDALHQLIIVNYMMVRVEKAKQREELGYGK